MADRKKTPDVLSSLLNGSKPASQQDSKPVRQQASKTVKRKADKTATSKPVKQQDSKLSKQHTSKTVTQQDSKPARGTKATFYLSDSMIEALEEGRLHLRKTAPKQLKGLITKSLIVEMALEIALEGRGELEEQLKKYIGE